MSRTTRLPSRSSGRCRPRLEGLESRLPLSASSLSSALDVVAAPQNLSPFDSSTPSDRGQYLTTLSTLPADGSTLTTPPTSVSLSFDRPINAGFLSAPDVLIEQQTSHGWVSVFDNTHLPAESVDPTGSQLTLTPAQPLAPGSYRLVIPATTGILGTDGSSFDNAGSDLTVASFTVNAAVSSGFAGATPLNLPISTIVSTSGTLDLATNPDAVNLTSFTLPAGHHWRLGAEVLASQIGSPVQTTLSVFAANGQLIATENVGRPNAPSDPFLFQGLAPGNYYLGVSGHDNVPGPTGYLPSTSNLCPEASGAYQLRVVADPADAPVQLLGSSLRYADPLDPHPTGFSLAFSGVLNPATLQGQAGTGIEVIDQYGQVVPITAVGQTESAAQYVFLFNQDVPAGHYSIIVPQGGVTDLAGYTPVASGQPAGVLATFNVVGRLDTDPHNLGPLTTDVRSGITTNTVIAPGSGVSYRFVVVAEGNYNFAMSDTGGSLSIQTFGRGGFSKLDAGSPGQLSNNFLYLGQGVYHIQFVNKGEVPTTLTWTLSETTSWDSLLNNGVGQGPALDLRLINPTSSSFDSSSSSSPGGSSAATAPAGQTQTLSSGTGVNAAIAPAGTLLTLGNVLVGRPSTDADHVAVVGLSAGKGTTALASSAPGLLQGIRYTTAPARFNAVGESVDPVGTAGQPETGSSTVDTDSSPVNGALVASANPQEPRVDEKVIAEADWLTSVGKVAARFLAMAPEEPPAVDAAEAPAAPIAIARDDAPRAREEGNVERAHIDTPLALGLVTLVSFRYNPPFLRWLKRTRTQFEVSRSLTSRASGRGPHSRF